MAAGSGSSGKGAGVRAGKAFVEASLDDTGLRAGLERARKMVIGFGKGLSIGGGLLAGLGGGIVGTIVGSFKEVVDQFDAIKKASDRLGTSSEVISSLGYAASQSGSDLEGMETALKMMQKNLEQDGDSFKQFGLDAEKLKGMKLDDQFMAVADAISQMEEGSQRTNAAFTLLGKSGVSMLPLMKDGSSGIKKLMDEAARVGKLVSSEDAANAERAGDAIDRAWISVKMTFLSVGAAILPQIERLEQLSDIIVDGVKVVRDFVNENRQLVAIILASGAALTGIGVALAGLGAGLIVVGLVAGGITAIGSALAFVAPFVVPIVAIGAAFASVGAIIASLVADFADLNGIMADANALFGFFAKTFQSTWSGISDALAANDLKMAFEIAVAGLNVVWTGAVLVMTKVWNDFKSNFVDSFHDGITAIKVAWNQFGGFLEYSLFSVLESIAKTFSETFAAQLKLAAKAAKAVGLNELAGDLDKINEFGLGDAFGLVKDKAAEARIRDGMKIKADAELAQSERNLARKNGELAAAREHLEAQAKLEAKEIEARVAANTKVFADFMKDLNGPVDFGGRAGGARSAINSLSAFGNATASTLGIGGGKTVEDKQLDELKNINKNVQKIQGAKAGI